MKKKTLLFSTNAAKRVSPALEVESVKIIYILILYPDSHSMNRLLQVLLVSFNVISALDNVVRPMRTYGNRRRRIYEGRPQSER